MNLKLCGNREGWWHWCVAYFHWSQRHNTTARELAQLASNLRQTLLNQPAAQTEDVEFSMNRAVMIMRCGSYVMVEVI